MKLYELIAKEELDGELIFNGINFDMTCSLCTNRTKVSQKAFELYGSVLNGEVLSMKDGYISVENREIKDQNKAFYLGKEFLSAISGYIEEKLYDECFPVYEQ